MQWYEDLYSPYKQLILLFIALILIFLYYNQSFKNDDYNTLALLYAIFILLWLVTIVVRYLYLSYYPQPKTKSNFFEIPYGMKCYFGQAGCEHGDFNIFSIFHLVCYTVIGYIVPGYYLEILGISILCELLEYAMGFEAKYIMDPIVNEIGYFIGTQLSYSLKDND